MASRIAPFDAKLREFCAHYQVKDLHLFGSAANDSFQDGRSDFDFLVRFLPCDPETHANRYFGLLESLEDLLATKVDLVEIDAISNPFFQREAEATRITLYAA